MIAHHVQPGVRLHVQGEPTETGLVVGHQQPAAGPRAVEGERLPREVERLAFDAEGRHRRVESFDRLPRQPERVAPFAVLTAHPMEAVPRRAQARADLGLGVGVDGEERLRQFRMPAAVGALAVVLHDELPVPVLDEVELCRDLRAGEVVRVQVRRDRGGEVVEVRRRLVGQAHEEQPADRADVHRPQRVSAAVEVGAARLGVPQVARRCRRSTGDRGTRCCRRSRCARRAAASRGAGRRCGTPGRSCRRRAPARSNGGRCRR